MNWNETYLFFEDYDDTIMMTQSEIRELIIDEHERYLESIGFDFEEYIYENFKTEHDSY